MGGLATLPLASLPLAWNPEASSAANSAFDFCRYSSLHVGERAAQRAATSFMVKVPPLSGISTEQNKANGLLHPGALRLLPLSICSGRGHAAAGVAGPEVAALAADIAAKCGQMPGDKNDNVCWACALAMAVALVEVGRQQWDMSSGKQRATAVQDDNVWT